MSEIWRSSSADYPKDSELERAWLRGYSIGREDMLHIRTALLTKLREGVADIYTYTIEPNKGHELILRHQVEALLEKAGE